MSEKTEKPTPQKLREARSQGQVAKSRMLTSAAVSAGGLLGLVAGTPSAWARLQGWTGALLLAPGAGWEAAAVEGLWVLAWLCGPALAGALLAAVVAGAGQAGLEAHPALLWPKLARIDPLAGFKRLFSVRQAVDLAKNLAIAAVLALLVWRFVSQVGAEALRAVWLDGSDSLLAVLGLLRTLLFQLAAVVMVLGLGDYLLARRRHLKDLMMGREEVKQEYKNSEGDPGSKAKRKSLHRALANSGPARGVHRATVVVVNPTHIAVALRYDPAECEAPYLVARGREEDALAIRREARRQGVPVVKDVPLARSLVRYDVGEEIPEELYRAAAAVLKVTVEIVQADESPRSRTS